MRTGYVYILASEKNGTLYTGVSSCLERRMLQHKYSSTNSFVNKYNCRTLVWFQEFISIHEAILHEKRIKGLKRYKKIKMIEECNPLRNDLSYGI